jgi:hypothetical protein
VQAFIIHVALAHPAEDREHLNHVPRGPESETLKSRFHLSGRLRRQQPHAFGVPASDQGLQLHDNLAWKNQTFRQDATANSRHRRTL